MQPVKAKKYLGQHFLCDENIARSIADTLPVGGASIALEVGPGMGVLTKYLLEREDFNLYAIELDSEAAQYMRKNYKSLNLIEADFLKLDISQIANGDKIMIIGNYPYNISTEIFFKVLQYKDKIPICSGMVQKEVAERIASKEGTKAYGITSVLLQAWYNIEYLFTVNEEVFAPPPKVKSAVFRMTRNERTTLPCDENLFKTVVKTAFNQRRKTLRNSLKSLVLSKINDAQKAQILLDSDLFKLRPEQLSVERFFELTNLIDKP